MATLKLCVLLVACIQTYAIPQAPPEPKTTIFADEKLPGEIFENVRLVPNEVYVARSDNNPYRLPKTTRPVHYVVFWSIDMGRLALSGNVEIDLVATQANVNEIVLHVNDLEIPEQSVELKQGNTTIATSFTLEPDYDFIRVRLANGVLQYNAVNPVTYRLRIEFGSQLRRDMYGIYRSWFRNNSTDEVKWMATTQFQATSARSAFPCYDEPSFKATFDIIVRRPSSYRSWTCTQKRTTVPVQNQTYEDDVFHRTPVMSTYLLALIVAEYSSLEVVQGENLRYEVIARPRAIELNQGQYAFEVGQELMAAMNDYTGIDFYSMSENLKITHASIPDFSAGAMENWGLLTYREAYLMYDPENTNDYYKQLIAYILSHEIVHMWFGNLVTCDWWDVLWLNEGFARYYQYYLTDWVESYMGLATRFITEQVHTSLLSDSSIGAHPLTNPGIDSPTSVRTMFSTISYNKGAAVIRMTEHLLGFDVHRQGLRNYLVDRSYDTASPIQLFQNLQAVAIPSGSLSAYGPEFNFIEYYKSWTEQAGHPVLTVHVNHHTGDMTITQRRFDVQSGYSSINTNWIIPISFATAANPDFSNTKPSHVISNTVSVVNRGSTGDQWVIFNKQQTGFYRVNYDAYTWDLIIMALRGPERVQIHEFNRAQIVNDVFQFARSGLMSYNRAFNIISFLENETEYTPWVAALTGFSWLRNRFVGTPLHARIEAQIVRWANTVMSGLTYFPITNESFMRSYLRYQLAPVLCSIGVQDCIDAAYVQFRNLVENNVEVPANSRNWVYCNGLRNGTEADFDFLWSRFLTHDVYTEKILILTALGCTRHQSSLNRFLDAIVEDNYIIRPQDYTTAFNSAVTGTEGNTQIVFEYIKDKLDNVTRAFGSASVPLSYISSRLRTEQQINEFQTWARANSEGLGGSLNAVLEGAEDSRRSIIWAATVAEDINEYLENGNTVVLQTTSTTAPATQPTTVTPPPIVEPSTPSLPGSAASSILSLFAVIAAVVLNVVM